MLRIERQALIDWLLPEVQALGYELVDVELIGSRNRIVRLYIDSPEGIGLGDCARVSRFVEGLLDVEDIFPGSYRLEVSSPGEDRPLRTGVHFASVVGQQVRVRLGKDGRMKKVTGRVLEVKRDSILVDMGEDEITIHLGDIVAARLIPKNSI